MEDGTEITEESILPAEFIREHASSRDWRNQYLAFDKETRDAAAKRLYDHLSPKQRSQLKSKGWVTFKCAEGHEIEASPRYANTTTVGCYSIGIDSGERAHVPTTIGDFLLALKIQFATTCMCWLSHGQIIRKNGLDDG